MQNPSISMSAIRTMSCQVAQFQQVQERAAIVAGFWFPDQELEERFAWEGIGNGGIFFCHFSPLFLFGERQQGKCQEVHKENDQSEEVCSYQKKHFCYQEKSKQNSERRLPDFPGIQTPRDPLALLKCV